MPVADLALESVVITATVIVFRSSLIVRSTTAVRIGSERPRVYRSQRQLAGNYLPITWRLARQHSRPAYGAPLSSHLVPTWFPLSSHLPRASFRPTRWGAGDAEHLLGQSPV